MIKIKFLGPIEEKTLEFSAQNVKNLRDLREKLKAISGMEKWLKISSVAINGVLAEGVDCAVKSGDEIAILPPVCGG